MDSQKNDESRNRLREEALARRVGAALDRLARQTPEECPDAGLIAAYHERALGPQESAQCENHFAACSRCRKVLAVLVAAEDAPLAETEIAHLGELVAAGNKPPVKEMPADRSRNVKPIRDGRDERIRPLDWRRRWLAPALGIAAVLAVWFAMRPPWRTQQRNVSEVIVAEGPKTTPDAIGGISAPVRERATVTPETAPTGRVNKTARLEITRDEKKKQAEADNKIVARAVVATPPAEPAPPALQSKRTLNCESPH